MVEIKNLSKKFAEAEILKSVSLSLGKGEFVSLLGPSGCGKTTLLRILAGLETPDLGSIELEKRDLLSIPIEKRPFRLVFQRYALFPHMNVERNVGFSLEVSGVERNTIKEQVKKALAMVRLEGFEARAIQTLSGGQSQRVALARAIVGAPQLLLLDEPLSALDQNLRREMQVELRSLQKNLGCSFLYVTHDRQEAMMMSDRIALMEKGEILRVDVPEKLYFKPKSVREAKLMGDVVDLGEAVLRPESILVEPLGLGSNAKANDGSMGSIEAELLECRPIGGSGFSLTLRTRAPNNLRINYLSGKPHALGKVRLAWNREDEIG